MLKSRFILLLGFALIGSRTVWAQSQKAATRPAPDIVSTRLLNDINWMEFREVVPSKIETVILPTGTLEPHGVINNGADNTAPEAMSQRIAREVNALVAPVLPYGITGGLAPYPGAFTVHEQAYRPFLKEILRGLARNGFKNIIVMNGHGGPQTAVLNSVASEVGEEEHVRTLVINWWTYCSDVTLHVFGEDGGHAGWNETAFIQAIDRALVHPERYTPDMALANPAPGAWSAYPSPASIGLYKEGQGYPKFDQAKADEYFEKVTAKISALIKDTIARWNRAGL